MVNEKRKYNLEERTACFGEEVILFVKTVKADVVNKSIISQLVRSAGSIGANYSEATEAESKRDFVHKIGIVKKEVKESQHWLRLLAKANPERRDSIAKIWKESRELLLIFSKSMTTAKSKMPTT